MSENRILKSFEMIRHTNETTVAVSDSIGNTPFKSNGISPMKTMPLRSTSAHQALTKGKPIILLNLKEINKKDCRETSPKK